MEQPYGLLLVGMNYSAVAEDEFNDWYDTEHLPERERTRGFINARRWLGATDPKISVSLYDLESLDVLQTPAYQAIVGDGLSPWSRRVTGRSPRICRFTAEQTVPGRLAGAPEAEGLMMYAMNVPAAVEAEYNAWFNEEHLPRLSQVPGVLRARRYRMAAGTHRYLALYDLAAPEVQASPAWKDAAGTPWSAKMRPHFKDPLRLVLRRYHRAV
jgi:hypothetical protein